MNISAILNSRNFKHLFIYAVFLIAGVIPTLSFAQESGPNGEVKKFSPKEVILEHIADSHSWHMIGKSYLPLPVILYTDKGLEVFSSAKIEPTESEKQPVYQGSYYSYKLDHNKILAFNNNGQPIAKKILDFSITRNVASMWMAMIVLLVVFITVRGAYTKRKGKGPKGLQSFLEPLVVFVRDDVAIPNIGVKYQKYMSLLLTIFFFILINNLFGLIPLFPGGYNLTGNIAVTVTLSTIVFLVITFSGNKYYWKHIFLPDIPLWLYPIMVPVEIIGIFSKPIALLIRLFANITAGHIVVLSLISLIFIFNTLWVSPVSVVFVVFMDVIELLVAFLQAFIFTMLSALFIGLAVEEHHH